MKQRKPFVALFASLVIPGLGQLYNGDLNKFFVMYAISLSIDIWLLFTSILFTTFGLIIGIITHLSYRIFVAFEAFTKTQSIKSNPLKSFNRWYIYIGIIVMSFFVVTILIATSKQNIETFAVRSGSMKPTLFIDDCMVANKKYFNKNAPKAGDIIVYHVPKDHSAKLLLHRVIATEGHEIEIRDTKVFIDNKEIKENYIAEPPNYTYRLTKIPKGHIFILGDNRNNSYDSHVFGPVKLTDVKGKIMHVYWPLNHIKQF